MLAEIESCVDENACHTASNQHSDHSLIFKDCGAGVAPAAAADANGMTLYSFAIYILQLSY